MLKGMATRVATLYAANGKFHSFVNAVLFGFGTGLSIVFAGGIPLNKAGWIIAGGVVFGAVKGAVTGWLRTNVAVASVQGVASTPAQVVTVGIARDRLAEAAAASDPKISSAK